MALSDQINELHSKLSALQIVLSAVCSKVAELTQYNEFLGTESFQNLLNFQAQVNSEILSLRAELDIYYQKIDQVRQALLGSCYSTSSSTKEAIEDVQDAYLLQEKAVDLEEVMANNSLLQKLMKEMMLDPDMQKQLKRMLEYMSLDEEEDEEEANIACSEGSMSNSPTEE